MPPSRKRAAPPAETEAAKKIKSAVDSMADEWVCPITTELPLDPVIAEDGQTYERAAIEELLRVQGADLKSPMTNLPMGRQLLTSTQARNTIEKLVGTGAIDGDKAQRWTARLSEQLAVKGTMVEAEAGDVHAMASLSDWLSTAQRGLVKDERAAFKWAMRGADLRDPMCMAQAGCLLLRGAGTAFNGPHGMALTMQAAMLGSPRAACELGRYYHHGHHGLPRCLKQARMWYDKALNEEAGAAGDGQGGSSSSSDSEPNARWTDEARQGRAVLDALAADVSATDDAETHVPDDGADIHVRDQFGFPGMSIMGQTVLNVFATHAEDTIVGYTIDDVARTLAGNGVTRAQVASTVDLLIADGHIYATVDDDHFKAT